MRDADARKRTEMTGPVDAEFAVYVQRSDAKGRKPSDEFARLSRALGGRGPDAAIRGRGATHKRRGAAISRVYVQKRAPRARGCARRAVSLRIGDGARCEGWVCYAWCAGRRAGGGAVPVPGAGRGR